MALVYMNGFESQNSAEIPIGLFANNGRYGSGYSWQIVANNNGFFFIPIYSNLTQFTAGLAILRNNSWSVASNIVTFSSNTGDNIRLASTVTNGLQLIQGSTTIYETAPGFLVNGAWYYFELSCVLATGATGSWELRVNGQTLGSGSSVRTAGTNVSFTRIGINRGSQTMYTDDIYVDDTAGQFKGEVSIVGLTPNGNGTYSQLTGSDGNSTDNYLLVDEVPASSTVSLDGIGSSAAFGSLTLTASALVAPVGFDGSGAFGQPSVQGSYEVQVNSLDPSGQLGAPSVVSSTSISLDGLVAAAAFGSPTLDSAVTVELAGLTSSSGFGQPVVSVVIGPNSLVSDSGFGQPSLSAQADINANSLASSSAFGAAQIASSNVVTIDSLTSGQALGSPTLTADATVFASPLTSSAIGEPSLTTATVVSISSLNSASQFGLPALDRVDFVFVDSLVSFPVVGSPSLSIGGLGPEVVTRLRFSVELSDSNSCAVVRDVSVVDLKRVSIREEILEVE